MIDQVTFTDMTTCCSATVCTSQTDGGKPSQKTCSWLRDLLRERRGNITSFTSYNHSDAGQNNMNDDVIKYKVYKYTVERQTYEKKRIENHHLLLVCPCDKCYFGNEDKKILHILVYFY